LWTFTYALGAIIYFEQGVLVMALENIVLTMISLGGLMNWMAAANPAPCRPKLYPRLLSDQLPWVTQCHRAISVVMGYSYIWIETRRPTL